MDPPLALPEWLKSRPCEAGPETRLDERIHRFDLDLQIAPDCPEFRGIRVFRDFLSMHEARRLLAEIERTPFVLAQSGKLKQHFGAKVNFNRRRMNAAAFSGLPEYARWIESRARVVAGADRFERPADRSALALALESFETMDLFVLRYSELDASNLDFHCDDIFAYGEAILDLSLESDSVLTFIERLEDGYEANPTRCVRVPLPARSLAVVYGDARFAWDHAILPYDIDERRTSVTLRTLSEALRQSIEGRRVLDIARGSAAPA